MRPDMPSRCTRAASAAGAFPSRSVMQKKDGEIGRAYEGIAYPKKDSGGRLSRRIERGVLDEQVFAYGVTVAAGPAAEGKLRSSEGLPLNMLGSTTGDHRAIETVAKALATSGAYDPG